MTRLVLAARVEQDLARITRHLLEHEVDGIAARVDEILAALEILRRHPLIGRPVGDGLRELVIGQGSRGYVARYRYDAGTDEARVGAVRAQREAGFGER
jgi:toxin ParE1/3/4